MPKRAYGSGSIVERPTKAGTVTPTDVGDDLTASR
jgi:hypothetical protein